jgi:outer membrane receptor protein involved in Fe transport
MWKRIHGSLAVVLTLLVAFASPRPASAQRQNPGQDLDIAAQPLADSIESVGEIFGLDISFAAQEVDGIQAPALTGRLTADQAFAQLLQSTRLGYRFVDEDSVVIEPKTGEGAPPELPTLTEEITVSATRREESLQDVPMSVHAVTRDEIEQEGIVSFVDYAVEIPNLSFATSFGIAADSLTITIRGVGGRGTTGFYIDDTPLPAGLNPRVIDLERIETLRGPQGTLFGARSMGGTIRFITTQPSTEEFGGYVHAAAGAITDGGESLLGDFSVNIPLSDNAALRLTGYGQAIDGFIDIAPNPGSFVSGDPRVPLLTTTLDDVNGNDVTGLHLAGRFELLDDRLTITPRFLYENVEYDGRTEVELTATSGLDNRVVARPFGLAENTENEWRLGTLTLDYDSTFGRFTSASSWFEREARDAEDTSPADAAGLLSGEPGVGLLPFLQFLDPAFPAFPFNALSPIRPQASLDSDSFTQELRFASSWDHRLQLTAGLFYQEDDSDIAFPPTALPPIPTEMLDLFSTSSSETVEESAVFAEATYAFTDRFRVILGGRQFDNEVSLTSFQGGTFGSGLTISEVQSESDFIPRFGAQFDLDDDQMLYATSSEGFRIGGPNTIPLALCEDDILAAGLSPGDLASFRSDVLETLELGHKATLANGRVRVNTGLFHTEWNDIQQLRNFPCGGQAIVNVGEAEIDGGELELDTLLTETLRLSFGAGYNDSEIVDNDGRDDFLAVGTPIQDVPDWTFNAALDWQFTVAERPLFARLNFAHVGDSQGRPQLEVDTEREAYDLVDVRFGTYLRDGAYTLTLFVENVTDESADFGSKSALGIDIPGVSRTTVSYPRTVGLDVRYRF